MTILKLLVGLSMTTLIESVEGSETTIQFGSLEEADFYLSQLGLLAWQLEDLHFGRTVGISSGQSMHPLGRQGPTAQRHP